jgi:hypothetical protein
MTDGTRCDGAQNFLRATDRGGCCGGTHGRLGDRSGGSLFLGTTRFGLGTGTRLIGHGCTCSFLGSLAGLVVATAGFLGGGEDGNLFLLATLGVTAGSILLLLLEHPLACRQF